MAWEPGWEQAQARGEQAGPPAGRSPLLALSSPAWPPAPATQGHPASRGELNSNTDSFGASHLSSSKKTTTSASMASPAPGTVGPLRKL